jgi:phosphonate metabolism protein (transferase hexapeptide repeat family)
MPQLSETPYLHDGAEVVGSTLGRYVEIGAGARITECVFGDYSYTDRYADIAYSTLGKFVNVAAFVRINPGEHPYQRASLHHFMYRSQYYWADEKDEEAIFNWRRSRGAVIGHDTWIGHGSVIMKGVTVGDGAIIGSLSVVTKDVPPYAIVAGKPAQFIKWRHPKTIGRRLQMLAWWNWDHEALRRALTDFRTLSAEAFLDRYEGGNDRMRSDAEPAPQIVA